MSEFIGIVALITGAASGIGRCRAVIYAQEGARVVVSDVNQAGGQETVRLICDFGGDAFFVKADVSSPTDSEVLVQRIVEKYSRLDFASNNAGIGGEQNPIGRLGQPEEVAELVIWLSSQRASFVTGAYYPVDGGYLAN